MLPFLACTDTPAEPETEETASFKAEKPPKDYGDWLVVDAQCSGRYFCVVSATPWPASPYAVAADCHHWTSSVCEQYSPYIETPPVDFWYQASIADDGGSVYGWTSIVAVSVLDGGPFTKLFLDGDKVVGKITITRVIND